MIEKILKLVIRTSHHLQKILLLLFLRGQLFLHIAIHGGLFLKKLSLDMLNQSLKNKSN